MAAIRAEVSAASSRSLSTVFEPLLAASARARQKVKDDAEKAAAAEDAAARKAAAAAARAYAQIEAASAKAAAKEAADADRAAQAKVKAEQKAFDAKLKQLQKEQAAFAASLEKEIDAAERAAEKQQRIAERTAQAQAWAAQRALNAEQREQERARDYVARIRDRHFRDEQRADEKETAKREDRAERIGHDAYQNFMGVARTGIDIAGTVAGGAGVDFDLGSYIGKRVSAETKAVNIVNQAAMGGAEMESGAAVKLVAHARDVANAARVDTNATLDVLAAFQGKSSDLVTGEAVLERLAKLAKVSGTEFADMGQAAGAVNAQLDATPDRAERLVAIMAHLTKQTADGSVEMSDYAKYVGVIAAQANAYQGTFDKNIGQLGALSQMAMKGGAYTAAMATGAAASFGKDLTKDKTLKQWQGAGIDVFSDETRTKLKDPEELLIEYVRANGADRAQLAKFFPNVVSKRAVSNALDVYDSAGGGAKGEAAIRGEFSKFRATLSDDKVAELYKNQEGTTANKVQDFNNKLEAIAAAMADRLLPQLDKLAPKIIEVVDALGRIVGWAAENPGSAITVAIVGSIAKAGIGDAVSTGLSNLLKGASGSLGAAGLAISVGAATFELTHAAINWLFDKKDKAATDSVNDDSRRINLIEKARKEMRETGTVSKGTLGELQDEDKKLSERMEKAKDPTSTIGGLFSWDKSMGQAQQEQADQKNIKGLGIDKADIAALIAAVQANKPPKSVSIDNLPSPGTPGPTAPRGVNAGAPGAS